MLAPDKPLHIDYQNLAITWDEYVTRYTLQIKHNPKAVELMKKIKTESESKDLYLVCVCGREKGNHCHRFLLIDVIGELE